MELEFDVRITANVLYDYMLRHTYYSMSGLIGTIVGALMFVCFFFRGDVIFLIVGVVILGYLPWTLWIKSRRQIEVSQDGEVQKQKWEDMDRAVSTQRSLIVYTSRVNASIFPKQDLGELTPGVIEMISTHMPPSKVKIKL